MYSILVVGAGYLGAAIAKDFAARKQRVYAVTREPEKAALLEKEGIHPVVADLTDGRSLEKIPDAHFIVLSAAPDQHDEENYRKIYIAGLENFLASRKKRARPYLVVLMSSTSVWKDRSGDWVEETMPPDADSEKGKILIQSENLVLGSAVPAVILRLSGIYGPGRNRLKSFTSGTWPQNEPDGYMNMIHVQDIVAAMPVVFKKAKEGNIYVGSDDAPALRSEFCRWLSEKTGKPIAGKIDTSRVQGKRCRNAKFKELGIKLKYPTFREGYENLI